jgi:hypothetical protein
MKKLIIVLLILPFAVPVYGIDLDGVELSTRNNSHIVTFFSSPQHENSGYAWIWDKTGPTDIMSVVNWNADKDGFIHLKGEVSYSYKDEDGVELIGTNKNFHYVVIFTKQGGVCAVHISALNRMY